MSHTTHNRTRDVTGRRVADLVRAAAALSIVISAVWFTLPEILGFTVVTAGLFVPRVTHLAGPFDAAFSITVLLATWSGVAGLYQAITGWDLLVHFITAGASAAVLYLLLSRMDVTPGITYGKALPARSIVVVTLALGMTAAVIWEFFEWAGNAFISDDIHVGYIDTLGDLAVGGAGATLAGALLAWWKGRTTAIQDSVQR